MTIEELIRKITGARSGGEWTEGDGDNDYGWSSSGQGGGFPRPKIPKFLLIFLILLLVILPSITGVVAFYTDLLWFSSLGFLDVIWQRIIPQLALIAFTGITAFVVYAFNWRLAVKIGTEEYYADSGASDPLPVSPRMVTLIAGLFAVVSGMSSRQNWATVMKFIHRVPFAESDPIFGYGVGFHVFVMPLLTTARAWLTNLAIFALAGSAALYLLTRSLRLEEGRPTLVRRARLHLFAIGSVLLLLLALRFWMQRIDLLFSANGIVFGMGYTDFHVNLPALTILCAASVVAAALLPLNYFKPMWKLSGALVGVLFAAGLLADSVLPSIVQSYIVKPNEYELEKPFLTNHIASTRKAFGLDSVRIYQMTPRPEVTAQEMRRDSDTVSNIRLWDYSPLLRTYKQLQEIRTYYDFGDVDIDRYEIYGKNRQVMLSVRELDLSQLQHPTWVNMHLEFTHGYGLVMNPVNEMNEWGLPIFFMQDLPPKSTIPIKVERPQIYYGEKPTSYALVNTDVKEFDYPMGDSNMRSTYQGSGGVRIGSLARRILYAIKFRDTEILFTSSLRPESRILYNRNIQPAIKKVAPFLALENDCYPVILDGNIVWLQDAYTLSSRYPYSRPISSRSAALSDISAYHGVNYIRNSVKITVDAYDGTMKFYVTDENDPLIRCWSAVFPGLFESADNAPEGLRAHFRYPLDYFKVQSEVYRVYHMTDTNTFYNREDVWMTTPSGYERRIQPNYVTMQLMDEPDPEFTLIAPFMPVGRNNLIGWMAARCDPKHYGELVVYRFPKQELIFGPSQIDALIDQNPVISSQLSLWSQRGSDVIRGDLLVIPIGKSLLYVQPLYLKAERGELPELKRVILSTGGRVAWGETFDKALEELLGAGAGKADKDAPQPASVVKPESAPPQAAVPEEVGGDELRTLIKRARDHYEKAQEASRSGDWARYGSELKALEETLADIDHAAGEKQISR